MAPSGHKIYEYESMGEQVQENVENLTLYFCVEEREECEGLLNMNVNFSGWYMLKAATIWWL